MFYRLAYPYRSDENTYKDFPKECVSYFLSEKWLAASNIVMFFAKTLCRNGINVLFFKYSDAQNRTFVSAKSKGSAFLANCELFANLLLHFLTSMYAAPYGAFFDLTLDALGLNFSSSSAASCLPISSLPLKLAKVLSVCLISKTLLKDCHR